ncbi:hypothetical protein WO83_15225, partial [Listeria monocytogenes]|nr:hypothetical protein [Listeria monocytogenes]
MWFYPGTKREKASLFNGKKGASLKHLNWHSPKKPKQSDQVHGNNLQSKLLEVQGQVQEQECLAISDYFVR